jgi:uncharacterized protein
MNNGLADIHADAALQLEFARHLRDPANQPAPPGLDPVRVATYRRLFFNNVEAVLRANFPVISRLLDDEWVPLVRRFYAEFDSRVPLFTELAREFVRFLGERTDLHGARPFLHELADYEWVELELMLQPVDLELVPADRSGDLLSGRPLVSPVSRLLVYQFPVHQIRLEFQPTEAPAQPVFLAVWRDRRDQMGFMELNAVSARLLALLGDPATTSGHHAVAAIATAMGLADPAPLLPAALEQLSQWCERDLLLGTTTA